MTTTGTTTTTTTGTTGTGTRDHVDHQTRGRDETARQRMTNTATWFGGGGRRRGLATLLMIFVAFFGVVDAAAAVSESGGGRASRGSATLAGHHPDGEVLDLSELNFDELLGRGTPALVKVYADWCQHCVALAPVWAEVARELEGELYVGRVDGPKSRMLVKRFGVKGYPTILLFRDGKMYEYGDADRSLSSIVGFARKEYRRSKSKSFFHAVWFSKLLRALYALPVVGQRAYSYLREEARLSNVSILFLTLCVPVMAGMLAIFFADMLIVRHVLQETRQMYGRPAVEQRPHRD
jgi:thioredoxin 1